MANIFLIASIPSLLGMLVYRLVMSSVHNSIPGCKEIPLSILIK